MKKISLKLLSDFLIPVPVLLFLNVPLNGQETSKVSPPLPDNINKIVSASCMPCHSSKGGLLPRGKLNFSEWTQYSPEKQKERAEKMYSVLKKGKMPPKSVRETRPDIIPTKEQTDAIKKWADSLKADDK